jgi:hypothetical protein
MSTKVTTIIDSNGRAGSGSVVSRQSDVAGDVLGPIVSGGLTALAGPSEPRTTVRVNGEKHTGWELKN